MYTNSKNVFVLISYSVVQFILYSIIIVVEKIY